jgi:hypothetical protein
MNFILSAILLRESSTSKSNLSNDFSNSSRSGFDTEHFNAMDVAFRDKHAACGFKFSFSLSISQYKILFLHILSTYSKYISLAKLKYRSY